MNFEIWNMDTYYCLFKSHLAVQIWTVSYAEYIINFYEIFLAERLVQKKKIVTLHASLTVNFVMEDFSTNIEIKIILKLKFR